MVAGREKSGEREGVTEAGLEGGRKEWQEDEKEGALEDETKGAQEDETEATLVGERRAALVDERKEWDGELDGTRGEKEGAEGVGKRTPLVPRVEDGWEEVQEAGAGLQCSGDGGMGEDRQEDELPGCDQAAVEALLVCQRQRLDARSCASSATRTT